MVHDQLHTTRRQIRLGKTFFFFFIQIGILPKSLCRLKCLTIFFLFIAHLSNIAVLFYCYLFIHYNFQSTKIHLILIYAFHFKYVNYVVIISCSFYCILITDKNYDGLKLTSGLCTYSLYSLDVLSGFHLDTLSFPIIQINLLKVKWHF